MREVCLPQPRRSGLCGSPPASRQFPKSSGAAEDHLQTKPPYGGARRSRARPLGVLLSQPGQGTRVAEQGAAKSLRSRSHRTAQPCPHRLAVTSRFKSRQTQVGCGTVIQGRVGAQPPSARCYKPSRRPSALPTTALHSQLSLMSHQAPHTRVLQGLQACRPGQGAPVLHACAQGLAQKSPPACQAGCCQTNNGCDAFLRGFGKRRGVAGHPGGCSGIGTSFAPQGCSQRDWTEAGRMQNTWSARGTLEASGGCGEKENSSRCNVNLKTAKNGRIIT